MDIYVTDFMREQTYFLTVNQGFGHRCQYHLGAHNFFLYIILLYAAYIPYNKKKGVLNYTFER